MGTIVALLLQGALGGAFVVITVLVLLAAVVVAAAVFGGALEDEGGSGGEATRSIIPPGTILAAMGLGFAVLGAMVPQGSTSSGSSRGRWLTIGERGFSEAWRAFSPSPRSLSGTIWASAALINSTFNVDG